MECGKLTQHSKDERNCFFLFIEETFNYRGSLVFRGQPCVPGLTDRLLRMWPDGRKLQLAMLAE